MCIAILLLLLLPGLLQGQTYPDFPGAKSAGLGHANVSLSNVWSVQNNIGALAFVEEPQLAFGFHTRLQLQELNTFGALAVWPLPQQGVLGASFSRYGTGLYSVQAAGLGYSHKISYISLGVKFSYLQRSIERVGSHGSMVLEAGGKAELLPQLHFAAHAYNLSQSRFSSISEERIPTLLKVGLTYLPTDKLQFHIQTFKDIEYPARLSAGIAYKVIPALQVRSGIQTKPLNASFGLGLEIRRILFDYAFQHQPVLGVQHFLSIGYKLQKGKKP